MSTSLHGKLSTSNGIHIPYQWSFSDSTARAATTDPNTGAAYTAADIGKFARQTDDNSIWMLTGTTPDWVGVSVNSSVSGLTAGRVVFVNTDGSLTDDANFSRTATGQVLIGTTTATTGTQLDVAGDIVVSDGAGGAKVYLKNDGSIGMGTSTDFGSGVMVIGMQNATTAPTTNPTGGGVLYVEAGSLKYRGSSGTVTTIATA